MAKNPFDGVSTDDLIAQNQALNVEQDAIRDQRKALATEIARRAATQDAFVPGQTLTADASV